MWKNINFLFFVYSYGIIHRSKSANKECYSKGGINIPVDSNRSSQYFNPANNPSFFILKVDQNVTITDELTDAINRAKSIVRSCDSRYSTNADYYPLVDVDNLINNGEKRPKSLTKKSMLTSIILGVGVYTELYYKSLPIVNYVQDSNANVANGFNYNQTFSDVKCSSYGKCETNNKKPHP